MIRSALIACLVLSSVSLFAHTHEGVVPVLRFADADTELPSDTYLKFVPEDVSFAFGGPQKQKFEKALALIEDVMNSEEFKQKVIGYENAKGERKYSKNYLWRSKDKLLTNEDIFQIIMAGDEKMRPGTPGEMNFNSWVKKCRGLETFGGWCQGTIGSTTPETSAMIRFNWKFYSYYDVPDMVANMVHEWIHLLGFLHGETNLAEEVPYVVGGIAGEVAANLLREGKMSNSYTLP